MTAVEKLADILKIGGKVRGFARPRYGPDDTIEGYERHHVEVIVDDILAACALTDGSDEKVKVFKKACSNLPAGTHVTIMADDLYHLLDLAAPPKAS